MTADDAGQWAAERAAERAVSAARRTEEIGERLVRLATGHRPDVNSVREAEKQAAEALARARESHERALAGHERAATGHLRAAEMHEDAARRGIGDPDEHRRKAAYHHAAAQADARAADEERAGAESDRNREAAQGAGADGAAG